MKSTSLLCLFVLVGAAACGDGGGSGSGGGGAGGTTATGGAGGATFDVECAGGAPAFPTFDKTCAAAGDCLLAFHQLNCCGTREAIGIAKAEKAAFDAAEATCESQYPACGCAQSPTMTEEGSTSVDEAKIEVQCTGGSCMSYVP